MPSILDIIGGLMLLGFLSAIALILAGMAIYYTSDQATRGKLMGAGGGVAVLTFIFSTVVGVCLSLGRPDQNQAIRNLTLLLLALAIASFLCRKFLKKD